MTESEKPRQRRRKTLSIGEPIRDSGIEADELPITPAATQVQDHAGNPRPSRDLHANVKLQLGFFVAFVTGVGTAVAGYVPNLQWLGFAGPLLAIIGFYIFGVMQDFAGRADTRQQFADSCYFLGFLLTMVAMLVGFLPAGLLGEPITSQGILRHFSMALGATALGLVFRIIALQSGRSLGQIAADVEATLTLYARKVSKEALAISEDLTELRGELKAQRAQVSALVTSDLREAVQAAFMPISESVLAISDRLRDQTEQISKSAQTLQNALGHSAKQLSDAEDVQAQATGAAEAAITSVAAALHSFESRIAELRQRLSDVTTVAANEIEKMSSAFEQGSSLAPTLAPALNDISTNVNAVALRVEEIRGQSDELAARVSTSLGENGDVFRELNETRTQIISSLGEAGRVATDGIAGAADATRNAMNRSAINFENQIRSEGQQAVDGINNQAVRFSNEITTATDRLIVILNDFTRKIEDSRAGTAR